jgi:hypothetical protein
MLQRFKFVAFTLGAVAVAHPIIASWIPRGNVDKPDCPPIASVAANSTTSSPAAIVSVYHAITDERYDAGFFVDRVDVTTMPTTRILQST